MLKKFIALVMLLVCASAYASDVEVWHDDSLKISALKKVFIMPVEAQLKAGDSLMPAKKLRTQLTGWAIDGINSAVKKGRITVKGLDALLEDMKFVYRDNVPEGDVFFKRAAEMGYKAFIRVNVSQEFKTEHVPESTRTWTDYKEIQKKDSKGKLIETIRIPEAK